jgi:hypothetical protein
MTRIVLAIVTLSLLGCGGKTNKYTHPFLETLAPYCGGTFQGVVVFPEGDRNPFPGQSLTMHIVSCTPAEIRIPFQVGEDKSRTWVLTVEREGLLLKHDHRHEDGTPDEITMYGGFANDQGDAYRQFFPADAHTAELIPAAATNEWTMQVDEKTKTFSYILSRDGQLRFRADFKLK